MIFLVQNQFFHAGSLYIFAVVFLNQMMTSGRSLFYCFVCNEDIINVFVLYFYDIIEDIFNVHCYIIEDIINASSVDRYLVYLDGEPFVSLLLASYWCLVLKLQLGSVTHSPLLVRPPGMNSPWKSISCLKIMKVRFAGCLRLICIAVVGLGAPLSRFLEGRLINS